MTQDLAIRIDFEDPWNIEVKWYSNKPNVALLRVANVGNGKLGVWLEGVKVTELPEHMARNENESECDNCGPDRAAEAERGLFVADAIDERAYTLPVRCPKCARVWGKLVRDQRRKERQ